MKKKKDYEISARTKGITLDDPKLDGNAEVREQELRKWYAEKIIAINVSGCIRRDKEGLREILDTKNMELYETMIRPDLLGEK